MKGGALKPLAPRTGAVVSGAEPEGHHIIWTGKTGVSPTDGRQGIARTIKWLASAFIIAAAVKWSSLVEITNCESISCNRQILNG